MERSALLDALKASDVLKQVPDDDLRFLIENGEIKNFDAGEYMFRSGEPANYFIVILSGKVRLFVLQNDSQREVAQLLPGETTGRLPYSRMTHNTGNGQALEPTSVLLLHEKHFREMIREHQKLTEALVHYMSTRIRNFTALSMQQEKLLSLGKLSAGLAHELNNPASAMVRSSAALVEHLRLIPGHFKDVMRMRVNPEQVDGVSNWLFELVNHPRPRPTLMQRTALEDQLAEHLESLGVNDAMEMSEALADFGLAPSDLDHIHSITGADAFATTMVWITDNLITDRSVQEINESAQRIATLIRSIKEYSYMDQSKDRQKVQIHDGIESTLTMLEHKARHAKVQVVPQFADDIPSIEGFPGELNQVWTNVIDNAYDAMASSGEAGTLTVTTEKCEPWVKVHIRDTGPGIPEDVQRRIFDPFFTTKPIGKGTGLGLDVVSKIIARHRGTVEVKSVPGDTVFSISLPIHIKA